ncbi:hypothetical protein LX16_2722 [Stackebrandtia albiflava]|uniref:Uncharacterized protein n=1 Tax=Stackebrandtia albiflava TaxID=406432 RepID=A0A562V257_9ACTN|nr:hypothetical protein [Stackebrandtia albiflava]TWJ11979.1 hypothetical protein LX16_2722 [Stackebrandtia albiflava]
MRRLQRVLEDFVHDLDPHVDVPMEAAFALADGLDSPALAELAGLTAADRVEIRELIPAVAEQLGLEIPSLRELVARRAREAAAAYLAGERDFAAALSDILDHFARYRDEGVGYRCCDGMLALQLWRDVPEYGDGFGSPEAAERAFRERAVAMTDGCPACPGRSPRG